MSPGLLKRMPSLEQTNRPAEQRLAPGRLELKKKSVEDLRRLYEERAGTVDVLGEVARKRGKSGSE